MTVARSDLVSFLCPFSWQLPHPWSHAMASPLFAGTEIDIVESRVNQRQFPRAQSTDTIISRGWGGGLGVALAIPGSVPRCDLGSAWDCVRPGQNWYWLLGKASNSPPELLLHLSRERVTAPNVQGKKTSETPVPVPHTNKTLSRALK